jgi:hypothetical protein
MQPRRPASVTAAGVMAILYGSVALLCGMCGLANLVGQAALGDNLLPANDPVQAQVQQELKAILERDVPGYEAFQIVSALVGLAVAVAILIAGIRILGVRPQARTLALTGCVIAIAATLAQAGFQAAYVMPAMSEAFQAVLPAALPQAGGPEGAQALDIIETIWTLITVVMVIIYVVIAVYLGIIIILLCGRRARAAFAGVEDGGFAEHAPEEDSRFTGYEDRDEQEWPRRHGRADGGPER